MSCRINLTVLIGPPWGRIGCLRLWTAAGNSNIMKVAQVESQVIYRWVDR